MHWWCIVLKLILFFDHFVILTSKGFVNVEDGPSHDKHFEQLKHIMPQVVALKRFKCFMS